jgi:hypothetical protein
MLRERMLRERMLRERMLLEPGVEPEAGVFSRTRENVSRALGSQALDEPLLASRGRIYNVTIRENDL